ncbi:hypothetical protein A2U01_0002236, partial [Trifolium medium]|nr:hypothetical protein [Trifolium medium]
MYLGKNGDIRAAPYPVAPPADLRALSFSLEGREKSLFASPSTSSIKFK